MDLCENDHSFVSNITEKTPKNKEIPLLTALQKKPISEISFNDDCIKSNFHKLNNAVWTTQSTSTLVKLYESKLEMLETPKKKTRIWSEISENFKDYNVDVTPDQVRWKINALTKKYKQCINMGKHDKFKYFKVMDNIYAKYNVDCDSYSITKFLTKKKLNAELADDFSLKRSICESRAMVEMRKARLANRIDSDRFQSKIKLERQWLEYLRRQEEKNLWRDKVFERNLRLRQEKLETRKKDLKIKESLENNKFQLIKKEQENFLQIEREKLELLKQMFQQH